MTSNCCETCDIVEESKNVMVFNEPGGLCLNPSGEFLYVANTNNHSIELVDLNTMVSKPLKITFNANTVPEPNRNDQIVKYTTIKMSSRGGNLKFDISLNLSSGIRFTTGAPQKWLTKPLDDRWTTKNGSGSNFDQQPLQLELSVSPGSLLDSDNVDVSFQLNLCAADVCFTKRFALQIPVTFTDDGLEAISEDVKINISRDSVQIN